MAIKVVKKFPGWPSGDRKPILQTTCTVARLAAELGIPIDEYEEDGWGICDVTFFILPKTGPVLLLQTRHLKQYGAVFYVDSACDANLAEENIMRALGIAAPEIVWRPSLDGDMA